MELILNLTQFALFLLLGFCAAAVLFQCVAMPILGGLVLLTQLPIWAYGLIAVLFGIYVKYS